MEPNNRKKLIWGIVGGCGCLFLLVIAFIALIFGIVIFTSQKPRETVENFYTSVQERDCEDFQDTLSPGFVGVTECDDFYKVADKVESVDYSITGVETSTNQGATVTVNEHTKYKDGTDNEGHTTFELQKVDGKWKIEAIYNSND